jgi:hypothetical protein
VVVGCPLLGELAPMTGTRCALHPNRLPRAAARVASGVLDGLLSAGRHLAA